MVLEMFKKGKKEEEEFVSPSEKFKKINSCVDPLDKLLTNEEISKILVDEPELKNKLLLAKKTYQETLGEVGRFLYEKRPATNPGKGFENWNNATPEER